MLLHSFVGDNFPNKCTCWKNFLIQQLNSTFPLLLPGIVAPARISKFDFSSFTVCSTNSDSFSAAGGGKQCTDRKHNFIYLSFDNNNGLHHNGCKFMHSASKGRKIVDKWSEIAFLRAGICIDFCSGEIHKCPFFYPLKRRRKPDSRQSERMAQCCQLCCEWFVVA